MTNPGIDSFLRREALGDASNFKGTDYHLVYAVWLLLCRGVSSVTFFAGNDLLVTPAAPPSPNSERSKSTQLLVAPAKDSDEWVQLRSTGRAWTVARILEGNLLRNFVCNSFRSESDNKTGNVHLITTQEIRSCELRSFAEKPDSMSKSEEALKAIVTRLMTVMPQASETTIRRRAIDIIRRLAEEAPVHRDTLVAELNEALCCQFAGDREIAIAASRRIRAALLEDASSSPPVIRSYDLDWLSKITDHEFTISYPLNESILKACDEQVARHNANQSHPFRAELCISRQGPDEALEEFLISKVPVFVLTGTSGIGKSWTLMRWASETLKGHPRVIVSRPDPLNLSLESLVHAALAPFSPPRMNDREILKKTLAQRALWSIARYAPKVVIDAVRLRFRLSIGPSAAILRSMKRDDRKNERLLLGRALRVLQSVDSPTAAAEILKFLPRCEWLFNDSATENEVSFAAFDRLLEEYDQTRVIASSFADPEGFKGFLADLRSDDFVKRIRAINALEAVAHLRRDDVSRTVIQFLQCETNPMLLSRLLWQAYHAAQLHPDGVLSALSINSERLWFEYGSAAAALCLLEVLLTSHSTKVLEIVPERFTELSAGVNALLGELMAFVRIRAGAFEEASFLSNLISESGKQDHKESLSLLEFHQLRAKSAALILSAIAESKVADWPVVWRHRIREGVTDFFMIRFGPWIRKADIVSLPAAAIPKIVQSLIDAISSAGKHHAHVLDRWYTQVRFLLECDCIDVLVALSSHTRSLAEVVIQLPDDWERLYAINRFLESGNTNEALLTIAFAECESKRSSRTAQASHEMNRFEIHLNRIAPQLVSKVSVPRSHFFFLTSAQDHSEKLSAAFDDAIDDPLGEMERRFADHGKLVDVVSWNAKAKHWYSVLISESDSRMCEFKEITPTDACRLARACVLGASAFPNSLAAAEHDLLYSAIDAQLGHQVAPPPTIRDLPNVIVQSHRLASEILGAADLSREHLRKFLMDQRGWQEYWNCGWTDDGKIQNGIGPAFHLLLFFPAVRLALCAVGIPIGWNDPGFTWMSERRRAAREVGESGQTEFSPAERQNEIQRFRGLLVELPDQEAVRAHLAYLLLCNAEYAEAQQLLKTALESPLWDERSRRVALYNLACSEARLGNETECRTALTESLSNESTRKQLEEDADFQSVRDTEWFRALCARVKQ